MLKVNIRDYFSHIVPRAAPRIPTLHDPYVAFACLFPFDYRDKNQFKHLNFNIKCGEIFHFELSNLIPFLSFASAS